MAKLAIADYQTEPGAWHTEGPNSNFPHTSLLAKSENGNGHEEMRFVFHANSVHDVSDSNIAYLQILESPTTS
jgi:hypothetical protein